MKFRINYNFNSRKDAANRMHGPDRKQVQLTKIKTRRVRAFNFNLSRFLISIDLI